LIICSGGTLSLTEHEIDKKKKRKQKKENAKRGDAD
jgi:hypothetical protein